MLLHNINIGGGKIILLDLFIWFLDKQGGIMLTWRVGKGRKKVRQSSRNDNILSGAVSETDNLVWNTNIILNNYTTKLNGWLFLLLLSQTGSERIDKFDNWPPEGFYNGNVYFSNNRELERHESNSDLTGYQQVEIWACFLVRDPEIERLRDRTTGGERSVWPA